MKNVTGQIYIGNIEFGFSRVSVMMVIMSCLESNETWLFFFYTSYFTVKEEDIYALLII